MAVCRFKQKFYHERGSPAKERLFGGMKEGNESMMRALPDRSDFALRGVRQIRGCQLVLAERVSQNSSQRPLIRQQRSAMIALAPRTVQCIPERLSRCSMIVLQPASMTPTQRIILVCGNRHSASVGGCSGSNRWPCPSDPLRSGLGAAVAAKRALPLRLVRHQVLLRAWPATVSIADYPLRIRFWREWLSVPGRDTGQRSGSLQESALPRFPRSKVLRRRAR